MTAITPTTRPAATALFHKAAEPIRVLLADDHPALRMGLHILLDQAPDIEVLDEARDGVEALNKVEVLAPDVIVLDCQLPGMSGPEVAAEIRRRGLATRVLALSAYHDEKYVRGMIGAGAVGYLLKEEAPAVIVAAVRATARGEGWFSRPIADLLAAWARGDQPKLADLTGRELEVLRLIASGKSNKEIAHTLQVVERTIVFHVSNILEKLRVVSRVEAAIWAKDHGVTS